VLPRLHYAGTALLLSKKCSAPSRRSHPRRDSAPRWRAGAGGRSAVDGATTPGASRLPRAIARPRECQVESSTASTIAPRKQTPRTSAGGAQRPPPASLGHLSPIRTGQPPKCDIDAPTTVSTRRDDDEEERCGSSLSQPVSRLRCAAFAAERRSDGPRHFACPTSRVSLSYRVRSSATSRRLVGGRGHRRRQRWRSGH